MHVITKCNHEEPSLLLGLNSKLDNCDTHSISLDIWDRKIRVNAVDRYGALVGKPVNSKPKSILDFAHALGLPIELLIEQFSNAGMPNLTQDIIVTESHQSALLAHLRKAHRAEHPSKILLTRSEVRKKRVLLYEDEVPKAKTQVLLEEVNDELLFYVAQKPELIYHLGHRKFEELVAKLFADRGYEVSLTKATRDGGYDIFAKVKDDFSEFIILAECKKYNPENKVGVEVVRGLYGVTEAYKANQGLIITSSFFSKDAHQEQMRIGNRIGLKDYNNLVDWIKPYSKVNP